MTRRSFDKARRDQASAGAGRRQCGGIFRIIEKAEVGRAGGIERRNIADRTVGGVAGAKLGARQGSDGARGELAIRYDKIPHVAGVVLGPPSEFRAAAEREELGAVVGLFEDRIGEIEAQRPEWRIPDDAAAGRGAHRRAVGKLHGAVAIESRGRRSRFWIRTRDQTVDFSSRRIRRFSSVAPQRTRIDEYGAAEPAVLRQEI